MVYVRRKFSRRLVDNKKLLHIYISLLKDHYPNRSFTHQQIKELLLKYFKYSISLQEIQNYCNPNFYEIREDVEQQMRNLDIRYD